MKCHGSERWAAGLLLAALLSMTAAARADEGAPDGDRAALLKDRLDRAQRAMDAGNHDEAGRSMVMAYALAGTPPVLLDLAHAWRRGGRDAEARALFQRLLSAGPRYRGEAEAALQELGERGKLAGEKGRRALVQGYVDRGRRLAVTGHYEEASHELGAAYTLEPLPLLLFNLAQVCRQGNHVRTALALFERFLETGPDARLRTETEGYVAQLRERRSQLRRERQRAEEERQQQEAARARAAEERRAARAQRQATERVVVPTAPAPRSASERRAMRVSKWVLGVTGLLLVGGGAALWALDGYQSCDRAAEGRCAFELNGKTPGIALVTAGSALVLTSTILFAVDYRRDKSGAQTALLTLGGRF